jgi:long-subunit acyl-CoA synthetase (AMP-forming)
MTGTTPLQDLFDRSGAAELITSAGRLSATALHNGANDWSRALRRAGIARGDRLICALPNGAAYVQLLVAALADGITLVPVPESENVEPLLAELDARVAIVTRGTAAYLAIPSPSGGPPSSPLQPRQTSQRTDALAFLLRSSGTTGEPKWIAIAERGVLSVLQSHLPTLAVDGASVLSVLPWHHAFGLILGLLPALLRARRIVTATTDPRDTVALLRDARAHDVTHMCLVPLLASRLSAHRDGQALLEQLAGGLVGGAPIDALLAASLSSTRLRVGYGQTEASPGIMLGEPGEFRALLLGRPVGCSVRIDDDSVLAFAGPNICDGYWIGGRLHALPLDRWHRTEDLVSVTAGVYSFVGRTTTTFKLANGKTVNAPIIERALRSRVPQLLDVVLHSRDGIGIDLLYSLRHPMPVERAAVEHTLGGLGQYLRTVTQVGADEWQRTSKGEIDRRHLPTPF